MKTMEEETNMDEKKTETKGKIVLFNCKASVDEGMIEEFEAEGLEIFQAEDEKECLKIVGSEKIKVVVADYSAGSAAAIMLLKKLKSNYPGINRACLSQTGQRREMISMLIKGLVSIYFELPRGLDELCDGLLHILHARSTLNNDRLLDLFDSGEILPVFPKTYHKFMQAVEADKSIREISGIVEKDISIAAQVLRIANSEFHRGGQFGSIERAGIYLGLDTIKNIVLAVSLSSMKKLSRFQQDQLEKIIQHSFHVNRNFAKIFQQQTGEPLPDQYASVGITHDIGKVILMQYLPDRFEKIVKYMEKNPELSFYRSEVELGFEHCTHSEIGAYFLDLWHFPTAGVFTALFHHSVEEFSESYRQLLDVFTIVNDLAH